MKTLNEMQKMSATALETESLKTDNRQYAIACTQMVQAMNAHAVGDTKMMWAHIERAKVALVRANEDERGQVRRALDTQAVVVERGAAQPVNSKLVASAPVRTSYTINNWIGGER